MTRLRIVFALVAVVVLVPLGLLVRRALASAQAERALERRAVADRVVDEMERELTAFLRREEDRPFSHYRHLAVPDDPAAGVALVRSPLADPLTEPFVVGPFQIAPDGTVTSPLWPDDVAKAVAVTGVEPPQANLGAAERIVGMVRDRFPFRPGLEDEAEEQDDTAPTDPLGKEIRVAEAKKSKVAPPKAAPTKTEPPAIEEAKRASAALTKGAPTADTKTADQRPGTTVGVGQKEADEPATKDEASASPLELLSQLNRAADARKLRGSKTEQTQAANVVFEEEPLADSASDDVGAEREASPAIPPAADEDAGAAPADPSANLPQTETQRDNAAPTSSDGDGSPNEQVLQEPIAGVSNSSTSVTPAPVVDVRVEPMVGRRLDERTMVLYRTVLAGDRAFRQGLVLDLDALVRWLAERALADAGGPYRSSLDRVAAVTVSPDDGDPDRELRGAVFRHRFAEPFGPAAAVIAVPTPAGLGSVEVVELLTLALAVAATLGLLALYRSVAVAVRYAERRSDFVSAVTHELKTPLTAIRMYGEMLRDGIVPDDARRQRYYETITAEGERLSRLVENVLELARLERRERPPALVVGDVGPVLKEALGVLAPHAEKQGFTLELLVEPGLPAARFDRDALLQIVFNLTDNAIKYSRGASEKKVTVRARSDDGAVVLTVADRGPGVAPRQLRHVFEPFWRGESELTRTTKGTGIGLALVRGLVARMGGAVSARNADGGGFEVRVRLAAA